jgi:hypothetical protein
LAAADQVRDQVLDQITCRDRPVRYSRRHAATISPAEAPDIRRDRTARVPEPMVLEDIRLRNRTGNRKDIVGRLTTRPTTDAATGVLPIKAVVATARPVTAHRATADALTAAATAPRATVDALPVAATAPRLRPADRSHLVVVVRVVALAAAVPADQVAGRAAPGDIANSQSEIKVASLHAAPNRAAFFAPPSGRAGLPTSGAPDINYSTSYK